MEILKEAFLYLPTVFIYSSIVGPREIGYVMMPRVEETLAAYLPPDAALSLKTSTLPAMPCRITFSLVGKAIMGGRTDPPVVSGKLPTYLIQLL